MIEALTPSIKRIRRVSEKHREASIFSEKPKNILAVEAATSLCISNSDGCIPMAEVLCRAIFWFLTNFCHFPRKQITEKYSQKSQKIREQKTEIPSNPLLMSYILRPRCTTHSSCLGTDSTINTCKR